ncbi:DNA ligase D [Longimicrobium sp.]|uniref:DNA ligase D n=1 Tax=Longimicrobium sp. TaxID=2029185 RepID=UPI002E358E6A|nr:DNA ligase D [Longimicrobium sp.]HEX6042670.1 DNA ligase D [Longimicrobium sp.]
MGLDEYKRKRDFRVTAEPEGHVHRSGDVLSFCIQKHAASHLHYDFRLELDGVLKSWAVPKGPSLDAGVKRLAVHVEDHPIEYGVFEGIIPKKEYGGGTVMLWDRGTWTPDDDPHKAYRKGHLRFHLDGERLRGGWHLVRSRRGEEGQKEQWLLFKEDDDVARPEAEGIITEEMMTSVATGRTMDEIAADADARWDSKAPAAEALIRDGKPSKPKKAADTAAKKPAKSASKTAGKTASKTAAKSASKSAGPSPAEGVPGARKAAFPAPFTPEMATLVDEVPAGDEWIHEIKYDGYRLVVMLQKGEARLITRNGNDWTDRFPDTARALAALPAKNAVLDGELVVLTREGRTSFQALQNVLNSGRGAELVFYAFDLAYVDGMDLRRSPLLARKEALRTLLAGAGDGAVRFSDHIVGRGEAFYRQACGMGLEGIMSKRADSLYVHKRTKEWLKVKCLLRQEFVIGGFSEPKGSRSHFGALLLGVHDEKRNLVYAGKVGTGFDEARLREVHARLKELTRADSPFSDLGRRGRGPRDVTWIEPELVCEIAFTEWTDEGKIRHPVFQGLREDKPATDVVRENPSALPDGAAPATKSDAPKATGRARGAERATRDEHPAARTRPVPPSTQAPAARARGVKAKDVDVQGVRVSSPDKVLYPALGITKLDLARYYEAAGEWMLPHVQDRPLTLVRCPDGLAGDCFYQKHGDQHFHASIGRVPIAENDGDEKVYTYVDSVAGLVGMVQMGVLEMHTSNAKRQSFEKPDRFVIDLDPAPDVPWARTVASAFQVRERLAELGLDSWVKTTGGKGLHVVVPLARRAGWDDVKEFTKAFSADLSARNPGKYLIKATIAARKGKIFIDYLRNGRGATSVGALCVRAKPTAAISVPLAWEELNPKLDPDAFTPDAVVKRLAKLKADPWDGYWTSKQSITKTMRAGVGLK